MKNKVKVICVIRSEVVVARVDYTYRTYKLTKNRKALLEIMRRKYHPKVLRDYPNGDYDITPIYKWDVSWK